MHICVELCNRHLRLIRRIKIKSRKSAPKSFYLDMNWLGKYWNCYEGEGRVYHHTGPVNQVYALREGLAMLAEEGLEACQERHKKCADRLWKGRIQYNHSTFSINTLIVSKCFKKTFAAIEVPFQGAIRKVMR